MQVSGSRRGRQPGRRNWFAARVRFAVSAVLVASATGVAVTSFASQSVARADTLRNASDNSVTGWYPNEPGLTPSAVKSADFGQLFDTGLNGAIYAQPLVSQGTVLTVTQNDYVYGLNATSGAVMWTNYYGPPADPLTHNNCADIGGSMGITGTPVIDPATDVAYFVVATDGGPGGDTEFFMDAVNVETHAAPANWPVGGVPIEGSADDDAGTIFDGNVETQRPGLVLVNGVVYAAFGSQCDIGNWTGWLVGVSEASASITTMWATETGVHAPDGGGGGAGIWQSGSAPVVNAQGDIFVSTGNGNDPASPEPGSDDAVVNYGEAVIELSASGGKLHPVDFFIAQDANTLNAEDGDLGSGGPMALPASMGSPEEPNVLLVIGKEGILYALNMDHLGGYQQGPVENGAPSGSDAVPSEVGPFGGVWAKPTVWPGDGGYVYVPTAGTPIDAAGGGALLAFQREVSASGAVWFQLVGSTANSSNTFAFGSGTPIVTSNGTTSGSSVLWITHIDEGASTAELEAYDPIPQNPGPDGTLTQLWSYPIGTASVFSQPTANDKPDLRRNARRRSHGFRTSSDVDTGTKW